MNGLRAVVGAGGPAGADGGSGERAGWAPSGSRQVLGAVTADCGLAVCGVERYSHRSLHTHTLSLTLINIVSTLVSVEHCKFFDFAFEGRSLGNTIF